VTNTLKKKKKKKGRRKKNGGAMRGVSVGVAKLSPFAKGANLLI
jgi:hypothetical protein